MADYYVDPEGGNDANNGTSFALRKKTIGSLSGLGAGDRIKVMASRAPNSLGNATWTDNSNTVTLATAKNATVHNCDSGWSGSTGVTATHSNTSSRREGTNLLNLSIVIATISATQKLAYAATSANLDLSAYQALSVGVSLDSSIYVDDSLYLNLCSDATGDVVLAALPLGKLRGVTGTYWLPKLLEYGGNLPSGINSISLSCTAKPADSGTRTFRLDNIIACKALSDPDHLSHVSVIGKKTAGEPEWYPVQAIAGTAITIGNMSSGLGAMSRPYRGVTETVTLYANQGTFNRSTIADRTVNGNGGSASSMLQVSGGWDRTAMATKDGETWMNGEGFYTYGLTPSATMQYVDFDNIGGMYYTTALLDLSAGVARGRVKVTSPGTVACQRAISQYSGVSLSYVVDLDMGNVMHNQLDEAVPSGANIKVRARRISGQSLTPDGSSSFIARNMQDILVQQIDNAAIGLNNPGYRNIYLRGCTFKWNTTDIYSFGETNLDNCKFPDGPPVLNAGNGDAIMTAIDGNSWDFRRYNAKYSVVVDSSVYRTTGYRSLKISVKHATHFDSVAPFTYPIMKVAGKAGMPIVFEAYLRRDNTGISAGIMTLDGYVAGVGRSSAAMSAAANTWELVTLTVTPTVDGVVELFAYAFGGTTYNAWVTEAAAN